MSQSSESLLLGDRSDPLIHTLAESVQRKHLGCCLQVFSGSPPTGGSSERKGEVKSGGLTAWRKGASQTLGKLPPSQSHQQQSSRSRPCAMSTSARAGCTDSLFSAQEATAQASHSVGLHTM